MGMADPRDYGIGKLKEDTFYDIALFRGLELSIERDIRRQKFACRLVLSAGYNNLGLVSSVKVTPLKEGMVVDTPKISDSSLLLEFSHLMGIAQELEFHHIQTHDRSETAKRIADLKERIVFLENVVYTALNVDASKLDGIRKLRE